jgi:polyisoprenoid-binding protein YceI
MSTTIEAVETVPAGTWKSDPVHSSVGFAVRHMGVTPFRGGFKSFGASLAGGRLVGTAEVESIVTDDENLTGHLLSPDFFDSSRFPELRFESSGIEREGDDVVVRGELTLKGITRPVELRGTATGPLSDPYGRSRFGLELQTTIDRTAFGLDWNAELPAGGQVVANDVELTASLELVEEA